MSKRKPLFSVLIIFILSACNQQSAEPISSFEGYFDTVISTNELQFDCSTTAKRNLNTGTEEGYFCNVVIDENTTIRTESGESLTVNELKKWEYSKSEERKKTKVILSESQDINTNIESREDLKASEIIILN